MESVRILEIELKGFKNTKYGLVQMPSVHHKEFFLKTADILGIYGQNGSGKTAVVEAMGFIQDLLMGNALPPQTVHYISKEINTCIITVSFAIDNASKSVMVDYEVELRRLQEDFEVVSETISAARWNGVKFETKKTLIAYHIDFEDVLFTPKYRYEQLVRWKEENKINLAVAKKMAQKEKCSFLFGAEGREVFTSVPEDISEEYAYIIKELYQYATINLFVITNAHAGAISINFMIPLSFRYDFGGKIAKGDLPIRLDEPSLLSQEKYHIVCQIVGEMNWLLDAMVPGLSIGIHNYGEQLLGNGSLGYKIDLISKREEIEIPLKYESEGILKIISVLNVLMCVYNNPSMCLLIDELDSGIFEYLLGELLSVFEKGAKGQLIFTSHNLRALEMLHKKSIIFSTTNPDNRYIRLQNVKNNNNLRDMYLRSIALGGQKEAVYAETDSVEIGRAFRRAGKAVWDGGKN